MPAFLGLTSRGLVEPLAEELKQLGLKHVRARPDAVSIECSWSEIYRMHMESRLATRFLLPVRDFTAYNEQDLYYGVLRQHDFTQYIEPNQTFRIEAHTREHAQLRDQRFVAMRVKDAIVDQFMEKFGVRPDVGDEERADLRVVVRIVGPQVSLALDLTGDSLSNRGYRQHAGVAPLRETVAAGLLSLSGWTAPEALVDPFCGSGTLLIEAALKASGQVAVKRRRPFAFERLRNFKPAEWKPGVKKRRAPPEKPFLFGYDLDENMIRKARENARAAGVENWILFQRRDVRELKRPSGIETGMIVTNPPYGARLESVALVKELMSDFSMTLKNEFRGWKAFILSGDPEASAGLRLKAMRKFPVYNGPIECRLLQYQIH